MSARRQVPSRVFYWLCASTAASLLASVAFANPGHDTTSATHAQAAAPDRSRAARSHSIGYPWRGRLRRAQKLLESDTVRYTGEYRANGNFYGTWELVQLIERAAQRVATRLPGAKLSVGELSQREGGRIAGHHSHQNGRDADLSFYMTDASGRPIEPWAFAEFDADGVGRPPNQSLRFDDARNWELIAKLVADGDARVQYILVSHSIRNRLLQQARRSGARQVLMDRASRVLIEPRHGHPHRNHFHVRIYCPPADRQVCRDEPPYWPWYPGTPPTP